jgi:pimeloyl-ACP methyl ester carboxylesterase
MKVANIASPLESRVFQLNGISLHVVLAGPANSKPLIFLHGFPEFWFAWRAQIDHFVSLGYRVVIPDQRGYNLSDKPSGVVNYSIDLLAADVVGLMDNVATSRAFIVEHDVGFTVFCTRISLDALPMQCQLTFCMPGDSLFSYVRFI